MEPSNSGMGLLEARALTYKIISAGFIKLPSTNLIKLTIKDKLFDFFPLELNTEEFQQGLLQLKLWSSQINETSLDNIVVQLNADYNRLFVGPNHLLAPPWESVYLTEERLTFDRITLDVREFYGRHGLEFILINKEPDDHFGVELEFMAELIHRQIQHLRKGQIEEASYIEKEQQAFLGLHLSKWTPHFTHSVLEGAHTDYYQGLARLARDFIIWDYEYLSREDTQELRKSKDEWEVG
ncbi:molecular chaperone [Desulfitobacterium sp. PCE1]|uniref:TorD/DmsD family molecular chaperone n=1 Tax=Desulfitobacterium sp. PCE1 TaxID=146907 RepID=UPI00036DE068|nr:molecular chaperone TorD family protein [Desulfitobacterium sp. PCE1]